MRKIALAKTGLQVSPLALGSGGFGKTIPKSLAFEMMDAFRAAGGNLIDTAHVYANWLPGERSSSEKCIGAYLRARSLGDDVIVATKGAHPDDGVPHRVRRGDILRDLEESREYLGLGKLPIYFLHRDDPSVPIGEILDTLNDAAAQGKIGVFGASNWSLARIREAADYAHRTGQRAFALIEPMFSYATVNAANLSDQTLVPYDREQAAYAREQGLGVMAYTSQARGFYTKLAALGVDGLPEGLSKDYVNPVNLARMDRLRRVAAELGAPVGQVALAWMMAQPVCTVPIVGPRSLGQLTDSLGAAELTLTGEMMNELSADGAI